jgi:hypothetical protein
MSALRTCAEKTCRLPFPPKTSRQRFHSPHCRDVFHNRLKKNLMQAAKKMGISK